MTNPYAKMLGINESRKYSIEEIAKCRTLYDRLVKVNNEINHYRRFIGFLSKSERLRLSNKAWKAVREYETNVPKDLQQILNFDTADFSGRMEALFKQQFIPVETETR